MKRSLPVFLIFVVSFLHSVAQFSAPPIQWGAVFGGTSDDVAKCVRQTPDGYIVAGYTTLRTVTLGAYHGSYDFWIVN